MLILKAKGHLFWFVDEHRKWH